MEINFDDSLFNPLYYQLRACKAPIILNKGGRGSGKSHSSIQKEVILSLESKHDIFIIRKYGTTLKDTLVKLVWEKIIGGYGLKSFHTYNKSERIITNIKNGSRINFRGFDDPEKAKGMEGATRILVDELSEFTQSEWLDILILARENEHVQVTANFNPVSEYSWIKSMYFDNKQQGCEIFETTYADNRFLPQSNIDRIEALKDLDYKKYQVAALNEWGIEDKSNKFAYNYDEQKHSVAVELNRNHAIYLSFDFNVDPISCMVRQSYDDAYKVIEMIKLPDSNIYALCDYIKTNYPNILMIVTGDATGRYTTALVKDKLNYYKVIKAQLRLTRAQLIVAKTNPSLVENKVLVNICLNVMNIQIDPVKAKALHYDLKYVETDEFNKIVKDNRTDKKKQADALDCFRYDLNTHYKGMLDLVNN